MLWQKASRVDRVYFRVLAALAVAVGSVSAPPAGKACDTPVYRFAMYNWKYLAVYRVYYIYHGQPDEADRETNARLEALAVERPAPANVALIPLDAEDDAQLQSLPAPVIEAWKSWPDKQEPVHLIFTPRGTLLHAGRLDETEVSALIDSPARTALAELLERGHSGVLVVLSGTDDDDSASPQQVVEQVIQRGKEGRIQPFSLFPTTDDDEDADTALDIGHLTVRRDDPAEQWFVRSLLQVEGDLVEEQRSMVFMAYGRGRVMEPYIGGGITVENLSEAMAFVTGACSCEVKEQNPGMDLLTHWDWETAALTVAERYGAEEGNEHLLDQENLFPTILIAAGDEAASDVANGAVASDVESVSDDVESHAAGGSVAVDQPAADTDRLESSAAVEPVANTAPPRQDTGGLVTTDVSFAASLLRNVGVIAAIACVGLLLVGFFLMRPRG